MIKIQSLTCHKVRNFDDLKVEFSNNVVIIGNNNIGKTSVLKIINSLFQFGMRCDEINFNVGSNACVKFTNKLIECEINCIGCTDGINKYINWSYQYGDIIDKFSQINLDVCNEKCKKFSDLFNVYYISGDLGYSDCWHQFGSYKSYMDMHGVKINGVREVNWEGTLLGNSTYTSRTCGVYNLLWTLLTKKEFSHTLNDVNNEIVNMFGMRLVLDKSSENGCKGIVSKIVMQLEKTGRKILLENCGLSIVKYIHIYVMIRDANIMLIDEFEAYFDTNICNRLINLMKQKMIQYIIVSHDPRNIKNSKNDIFVMNKVNETLLVKYFEYGDISKLNPFGLSSFVDSLYELNKTVILCEGISDYYVISNILKTLNLSDNANIIDVSGCNNLLGYVKTFEKITNNVIGVCDKDAKIKRKNIFVFEIDLEYALYDDIIYKKIMELKHLFGDFKNIKNDNETHRKYVIEIQRYKDEWKQYDISDSKKWIELGKKMILYCENIKKGIMCKSRELFDEYSSIYEKFDKCNVKEIQRVTDFLQSNVKYASNL